MKYEELVENINELLMVSEQDKINVAAYLIMVIQKINESNNPYSALAMDEFVSFISNSLLYINKDQSILNDVLEQMKKIVSDHSVDYLEFDDIYPLYLEVMAKINNSIVYRRCYMDRVINDYYKLIMFNAFTSDNYIIDENEEYLSDKEYKTINDILELKKEM